jgi:hypothetical protein
MVPCGVVAPGEPLLGQNLGTHARCPLTAAAVEDTLLVLSLFLFRVVCTHVESRLWIDRKTGRIFGHAWSIDLGGKKDASWVVDSCSSSRQVLCPLIWSTKTTMGTQSSSMYASCILLVLLTAACLVLGTSLLTQAVSKKQAKGKGKGKAKAQPQMQLTQLPGSQLQVSDARSPWRAQGTVNLDKWANLGEPLVRIFGFRESSALPLSRSSAKCSVYVTSVWAGLGTTPQRYYQLHWQYGNVISVPTVAFKDACAPLSATAPRDVSLVPTGAKVYLGQADDPMPESVANTFPSDVPVLGLGPGANWASCPWPTWSVVASGSTVVVAASSVAGDQWAVADVVPACLPWCWTPVRVQDGFYVVDLIPSPQAPWKTAIVDVGRWHSELAGVQPDIASVVLQLAPSGCRIAIDQFVVAPTLPEQSPADMPVRLGCGLGAGSVAIMAIRRRQELGIVYQA